MDISNTSKKVNLMAIVAMGENRVIGKNNQLLWHLPNDLKHFKQLTTGHTIVMGRKTYDSIGRPLPNRTNIVLTRDPSLSLQGCTVIHSLDEIFNSQNSNHDMFVIGGTELYQQTLPFLSRIYLTLVHQTFEGDAYFPDLEKNAWHETSRIKQTHDATHAYDYSFIILERIQSNKDKSNG